MTSYVVFGSRGQVGSAIVNHLEKTGAEVKGYDRSDCDISARKAVEEVLQRDRPVVVFNAAGFNDVDQAESLRDRTMATNAAAAGSVARACRAVGARLVHFSSAYVFGDGHAAPIDEGAVPDPLSVFGRSKLLGERLVQQHHPESFIIRTSCVYSTEHDNFMRQMVRLGLGQKPITMIEDEYVSPTWAGPVAAAAIKLSERELFGTYHASASGSCSWYEFAQALFEELDINVDLRKTTQQRWGAPARRPAFSALDSCMLRVQGINLFDNWRADLRRFLDVHGEALIWDVS